MKLRFGQATDRGRVRENNEDSFAAAGAFDGEDESKGSLFVVADGLGGLEAGEIASSEAVNRLVGIFRGLGPRPFEGWLLEAVQAVNTHVHRLNRARAESPMATTLTACHFHDDHIQIAHVGDCRVYRRRRDRLECLTQDHSDGRNSLTRAIGIDAQVAVDMPVHETRPGDIYLCASDGLYGEMSEEEMEEALLLADPQEACRQLIRISLDHGGYDNATAQVIRVDA